MQNHYGDDGYSRLLAIHGWLKISSNLSPPISRKQDVDRKNATTFSTAILCSDIVSTQSDQKLY